MNNPYTFNKSLSIGLWILLLSTSITNAINVLSLVAFGTVIPFLGQFIKYTAILASALMLAQIASKYMSFVLSSLLLFIYIWYRSYVFNVDAMSAIEDNISPFFFESLPYMWIFYGFCKLDVRNGSSNFFPLLLKICKVKLVLALFAQLVMFIFPASDIFKDYMNAANAILLGLNFITVQNIVDKHSNKLNTLLEIISLLFILKLGSRGAIMCYASVYLLYYIFVSTAKEKRKAILLVTILGILALIIFPILRPILYDSSSRYIELLNTGALFYDENRALIFGIVMAEIIANPMGLGVMADRPLLLNSNEVWSVYFAHNMELEMALNFGYIGFVIFGLLIIQIIKIFMKKTNLSYKVLLIALVSSSIIKLQVSSSYWVDPIFWGVVGYVLAWRKYKSAY